MRSGKIKIGRYELGRVWLAPMAGYTDIAFRELCKSLGAGLTVTEMVSVRGLVRDNAATETLLRLSDMETPSCVQLFGSDPDEFARAASKTACDIIDINMGCPMPKIVKNGDGAALMLKPELAGKIVRALIGACDRPITVKTRLGYHTGEPLAAEIIQSVSEAGAAAVTVHGRYAEQRYAGSSDKEAVKALKKVSCIPVIYNGDVNDSDIDDILKVFDGVAVGRAALKNPAIFNGKKCDPYETARAHVRLLTRYFDDRYTVNQARKFFVHYFKGERDSKAIRGAVNVASSAADIIKALDNRGA